MSAPLDKNTATYTASICRKDYNTKWCTQKVGWNKIDQCHIANSGDTYYLVCELGNKITPHTYETYAIKVEGKNKFGTRTEKESISPRYMERNCIKGRRR